MPAPGRALGVDLGARRVGLALSDPLRILSSPLATISMTSEHALVESLRRMYGERGITLVVIGLPLSADGSEGAGCARARRIAEALQAGGVEVKLQDERWSSRDAEEILRETGKRRRTSKEKVDAIAASLILRDYLQEASRR
ncbi:MAG: Holliday junction resolvase RuvX [Spirochaetia bacterium]